MSIYDYKQNLTGFEKIQEEIKTLTKYGIDYTVQRGLAEKFINRLHPSRLSLKVSEIRQETATSKTFRFTTPGLQLPPFQAGQYINIFVKIGEVSTSRPYSLSSAPHQTGYYDITVRRVQEGFVSNYLLDELKVGDTVESTSPAGYFFHNPLYHGSDLVFLAGGSGVTPFMSMIREVTDRGLDRKINLIYGSRNTQDIIFREELEDRASRHPQLQLTQVISEPDHGYSGRCGFITAALLKEILDHLSEKTFYLCGPEVMYMFCRQELSKLNMPDRKIRTEMFGPSVDIASDPKWPGQVSSGDVFRVSLQNGKNIPAKAGEPLMIALERAGLTIPSSCRSGECSLCRTKLLSGKVFHPQSVKLRKSDIRFGYIHPCAAYPLENLEIMI